MYPFSCYKLHGTCSCHVTHVLTVVHFTGFSHVLQYNKLNDISRLTSPGHDFCLLMKSQSCNNEVVADEFSSFMFWRQPLPSVSLDDLATILASQGDDADAGDDVLEADFDEFNYWRVPIPQLDITDLLSCLHQL